MTSEMSEVQKARWSLFNHLYNKICDVPDFSDFRSNTFCVLASIWLHPRAEKEGLLDGEEWHKPECRNELLEKLRTFLIKHIR